MASDIRVLHVDDDEGLLELASTFLERHDARLAVETATSASEGLDRLRTGSFDCIVSDYDMPDTDGLEFLAVIREHSPDMPFVLFTGKGSEEIASAAISAGVTDYLQKGTGTDQYAILAHRVRNAAERMQAEQRYRSLFENNPVVIWEEDLSAAKTYLTELAERVGDVEAYIDANPEVLGEVYDRIEVIDVNERALEYYAAESKAELVEGLDGLVTDESFEANKALYASVARGETHFRTETVIRTLDGQRRDELLELRVPEPSVSDYSRVFITATDITARKDRERELERQNARLDEVVSMLSHDLRTPLTVVEGRLELAAEACESEHLDAARRTLDRCRSLTEDLLTLASEDERHRGRDAVSLAAVAQRCWSTVSTADASLRVETDRTVVVDSNRLYQLLSNLFQNAVTHAGADVTVTVGALADGFYVADDGVGIPAEDRGTVFESGYTTDPEGTGLGLDIVGRVAEGHGWDVDVCESEGGGARFELRGVEFAD